MADEDELARLRAENEWLRAKIAELQKNQWWYNPAYDDEGANNNLYTHDNYERTGNAAYAWESLWYAHYNRHPIPWWVQEYLINLAWRILELTGLWPRRLPSIPPPPNTTPPDPDLLQRRIAQAVNARADTGTTFRGFVGGIIYCGMSRQDENSMAISSIGPWSFTHHEISSMGILQGGPRAPPQNGG